MTDNIRRHAVDSLESAADSVRAAGDKSAGAISDLANGTGRKLDSTASCIRTFDMLHGMRSVVRRKPVECLALATGIGLIAGFYFRRNRPAC